MKLAIFSDVHGNLPALLAVLADIAQESPDAVYHLGDLVGYNPFPNEVVAKVRDLEIPGIIGNYDLAVVAEEPEAIARYLNPTVSDMALDIYHWTKGELSPESRQYLNALPDRLTLEFGGWRLFLTHGSPRSIREYVRPRFTEAELAQVLAGIEAEVILAGHTHIPQVRQVDGKTFVNPGSVGFPKDGDPRAVYAILNLGEELEVTIKRIAYPVEDTARMILAQGLPAQAAEGLRHGRRLRRTA